MTVSVTEAERNGEGEAQWLTERQRCCRRASWQCGSGPPWLVGCWAAGTDERCAWTSVAATVTSSARARRHRESVCVWTVTSHNTAVKQELQVRGGCSGFLPYSEVAWRYGSDYLRWSFRRRKRPFVTLVISSHFVVLLSRIEKNINYETFDVLLSNTNALFFRDVC